MAAVSAFVLFAVATFHSLQAAHVIKDALVILDLLDQMVTMDLREFLELTDCPARMDRFVELFVHLFIK